MENFHQMAIDVVYYDIYTKLFGQIHSYILYFARFILHKDSYWIEMKVPNWGFTSPEKVFTATDNALTTPDWLGKPCK